MKTSRNYQLVGMIKNCNEGLSIQELQSCLGQLNDHFEYLPFNYYHEDSELSIYGFVESEWFQEKEYELNSYHSFLNELLPNGDSRSDLNEYLTEEGDLFYLFSADCPTQHRQIPPLVKKTFDEFNSCFLEGAEFDVIDHGKYGTEYEATLYNSFNELPLTLRFYRRNRWELGLTESCLKAIALKIQVFEQNNRRLSSVLSEEEGYLLNIYRFFQENERQLLLEILEEETNDSF